MRLYTACVVANKDLQNHWLVHSLKLKKKQRTPKSMSIIYTQKYNTDKGTVAIEIVMEPHEDASEVCYHICIFGNY